MAMDDDSTARRRRRRPHGAVTEVPSGGGNDASSSMSCDRQQKRNRRNRKNKKRRRNGDDNGGGDDVAFPILVLRVGTVLALIVVTLFSLYRCFVAAEDVTAPTTAYDDDDADDFSMDTNEQAAQDDLHKLLVPADGGGGGLRKEAAGGDAEEDTGPPFPVWNLTGGAAFDAYGIAERCAPPLNTGGGGDDYSKFWRAAAGLRTRFANNYGGTNAARALLERGLSTFGTVDNSILRDDIPTDLRATACRIRQARSENRPFRFAFGGYSVTAGRGNYFSQSFPFFMEQLLHTAFSLLGMRLSVINAAIGGAPAFPYGWCMSNFWVKNDPVDVISWDFSMNEAGGDPAGLEAYVRHALQLPNRPKLLVKDTHMASERRNVLQRYASTSTTNNTKPPLLDPVVVHTDPAAAPFLEREEQHRPDGFREWRKFGSPPGAPGQALHHPAVKEHEFIAWLLAMHFLSALELVAAEAAASSAGTLDLQCGSFGADAESSPLLSRPIVPEATNTTKPWVSLMYGEPTSSSSSSLDGQLQQQQSWKMNPVHCRTSFEPLQSGDLSEVIWSGSAGEDVDILLPKSLMYYNKGWVLDMSDSEKTAKHKLDRYGGGLGFVDSKKAYYGLYSSGPLRLFLPHESQQGTNNSTSSSSQRQQQRTVPKAGDLAITWFKSVVLCEVNEKRDADSCNTDRDVTYVIGGINVTDDSRTMIDAPGALYLGRKLCVYLPVPPSARLMTRSLLMKNLTATASTRGLGGGGLKQHLLLIGDEKKEAADSQVVGLAVEARVRNNHIMRPQHACSISHVIWEQQQQQQQQSPPLVGQGQPITTTTASKR